MLHDKHLLMIVSVLALLDILATVAWILIDPMSKHVRNLTNVVRVIFEVLSISVQFDNSVDFTSLYTK